MVLAAVGQIVNGLSAVKSNPLRAVAFTGFGLFWLSIVAIELLPGAGYGAILGPMPLVGYLAMWGIFCLVLAQGSDNLTRSCRITFALLAAFLFLLSIGHVTGSTTALHSAAFVGFACSIPGLDTHQRALDAGCTEHGASVHFVTATVDGGPVIRNNFV